MLGICPDRRSCDVQTEQSAWIGGLKKSISTTKDIRGKPLGKLDTKGKTMAHSLQEIHYEMEVQKDRVDTSRPVVQVQEMLTFLTPLL